METFKIIVENKYCPFSGCYGFLSKKRLCCHAKVEKKHGINQECSESFCPIAAPTNAVYLDSERWCLNCDTNVSSGGVCPKCGKQLSHRPINN